MIGQQYHTVTISQLIHNGHLITLSWLAGDDPYYYIWPGNRDRKTDRCCFDAVPSSPTMVQRRNNAGQRQPWPVVIVYLAWIAANCIYLVWPQHLLKLLICICKPFRRCMSFAYFQLSNSGSRKLRPMTITHSE